MAGALTQHRQGVVSLGIYEKIWCPGSGVGKLRIETSFCFLLVAYDLMKPDPSLPNCLGTPCFIPPWRHRHMNKRFFLRKFLEGLQMTTISLSVYFQIRQFFFGKSPKNMFRMYQWEIKEWTLMECCHLYWQCFLTVAHFQQSKEKASGDPTLTPKSPNCVPVK